MRKTTIENDKRLLYKRSVLVGFSKSARCDFLNRLCPVYLMFGLVLSGLTDQ